MDIILSGRDEELLRCLTSYVRLMSLRQMALHWWNGEIANARRRMKQLTQVQLVVAVEVFARPILTLDRPVAVWQPGQAPADFRQLAWFFQQRLRRIPARVIKVYVASERAASLFGGRSCGELTHPAQAGHDLGVTAIWMSLAKSDPLRAGFWVGEDLMTGLVPGEKRPDAFLVNESGHLESVVEFGGDYDRRRVEEFHQHCAERNLSYELW